MARWREIHYSKMVNGFSLTMNTSLLQEFISLLGANNVLHRQEDLILYEYDGSVEKARPDAVVFPRTTQKFPPS